MSQTLFNTTRIIMFGAFCLLFGIGQTFAQSQASTGQITGVVSDSAGAVVPNATVVLTSKDTNQEQTATTSDDGVYRFVTLQPGTYSIKATGSGFGEQTANVEVQVGRTVDANLVLGVAGTTAEVTITAEGVQSTTSNFDAVQSETAINNLPINGRRFQDFVTLTPNAQVGSGNDTRGQISLSGQRGINSNINVDGVDFNQPFFGGVRGGERSNQAFTIPQESIKEFNVIAAGYSAEFGRSSGGIVNAVTKSGTNDFRGSAFYLIRPEKLARGNDFAKALEEQRLNRLGVDATLAPTQQQFGGSVGGPIVEDKLFFFGSYEQQKFKAPRQVLFPNLIDLGTPTTPLNAGQLEVFNYYRSLESQFDQTNDAYAALGKIDYNFSDLNRLNVRYNYSQNKALNSVSTGETSLDPTTNRGLSTNGTEEDKNQSVVAQLINGFGASVINEARFQFATERRPRTANEETFNLNSLIGEFGTRNFLPTTQKDRRIQVADSLTVTSGNHNFKFGGEFSNIFADQSFGFNQFGAYSGNGAGAGSAAALQTLDFLSANRVGSGNTGRLGRYDFAAARYRQQIGDLQAAFNVQELAFFAQDSWRITPRLTFNYGLRFEKQFNPEAEANNTPVIDAIKNASFPLLGGRGIDPTQIPDSQNQWGPRIGFAYDPIGNGKTVIRAFSGLYYARTPLITLAAPFNNFRDPAGDLSVTLGGNFSSAGFNQAAFDAANPQYVAVVGGTGVQPSTVYRQFAILGINLNNVAINNLPTLTTTQLSTISNAIRSATTNPASSLGFFNGAEPIGITPDFKNPQSFQFGGGFEREIGNGQIIGLDYSQVNTIYLQRNRDINIPGAVSLSAFAAANGVTLPAGADDAQRPYVGISRGFGLPAALPLRARPVRNLGQIQLRDSSARSLYRSLTFRYRVNRRFVNLSAYYTLSKNTSDDDNERDSGGVLYSNPYDLRSEYYLSRLDRRHQFVANPVVFLPFGFEVASAVRLRSGTPVNATANADLNGDGLFNDRPYAVPGIEFRRNSYRNRNLYDVDLRVQKGFTFAETRRLVFSAEFFNILNRSNLILAGTGTTAYCSSGTQRCGLDGATNVNFLQIRDQNPSSINFDKILLSNSTNSQVFQAQFGARFQF